MNYPLFDENLYNEIMNDPAKCDYLTGLANRRGLYDYYELLNRETVIHAIFCDIDNFKKVNDIYGHSMGDKLLVAVSNMIKKYADGFTSRIGGDEYVVLLDGSISDKFVVEIAKNLVGSVQKIQFRKDILSLISLSVGIVYYQPCVQTLDDILAKCDEAMYQAKYNGKNNFYIYDRSKSDLEINRIYEQEMQAALDNREFKVYLQPKVNMISSQVAGAEALSRWYHPGSDLRSPVSYIPLFEKNGFVTKLDMYVFEEVCRLKSTWKGEVYEHVPISINMSRHHLYDDDFPEQLAKIADSYHVPHDELEIEVTENVFIKDQDELVMMVNRLHAKKFLVSIDDFGSGFSALNLLKDLEVDTIKIDKEFLQMSSENARGKQVIKSVIRMCRDLKIQVVTEGIEKEESVQFISRCGCSIAQGFYFSKPLPVEDFELFAKDHMKNSQECHHFSLDGVLTSDHEEKADPSSFEGELVYHQGIYADTKALYFPGGEHETNCLELPADLIKNDSYTISMWIKPEKIFPWTAAIYVKFEDGFVAIVPMSQNGCSDFRLRDTREIDGWHDIEAVKLFAGSWWHVCMSYNSERETMRAFINGELVNVIYNVPNIRYTQKILVGSDIFQDSFCGEICEIIIYNEAKDNDFVSELHQQYRSKEGFIALQLPIS